MKITVTASKPRNPESKAIALPIGDAALGVTWVCGDPSSVHVLGTLTDENARVISTVTTVVDVKPVITAMPAS